jgi:hypothetical protein
MSAYLQNYEEKNRAKHAVHRLASAVEAQRAHTIAGTWSYRGASEAEEADLQSGDDQHREGDVKVAEHIPCLPAWPDAPVYCQHSSDADIEQRQ